MKTTFNSLSAFLLLGLSLSALGSDFLARVDQTYRKTDKNFDLDCRYSLNESHKIISPVSETRRESSTLSREFVIETESAKIPMSFKVNRNSSYEVILDRSHVSRGVVSKRDFFIAPVADKDFGARFETSQIFCSVNFAYARPFELNDGDYHISVHPQTIYDWQSRLSRGIEELLQDPSKKSVIFLESTNFRGEYLSIPEFFNGDDLNLPLYAFETELTKVPEEIPLVVSPAGNSRFEILAKKHVNVLLTGGNHNYCIWNVTRHILQNYFSSRSEAKITLRYDLDLIVAQAKGMEQTGLNFPRGEINRSNLLRDLLSTPSRQASYHGTYIQFFTGYLAREYEGTYKTFTVGYSAPGYTEEIVLKGSGIRNLRVDFIYE